MVVILKQEFAFRLNNCWLDQKVFKIFVSAKWRNLQVSGCKAFVVKEKLKLVKGKFKVWNKEVFGWLDLKIENIVSEMNDMDLVTNGVLDGE